MLIPKQNTEGKTPDPKQTEIAVWAISVFVLEIFLLKASLISL
jgi:hypothetical protein